MTTFATLFSGGELAGVGMRNAGLVGGGLTVSGGLTGMTMCGILVSDQTLTERGSGALFLCQSSVQIEYSFYLKKRLCFAGGLAPFGLTSDRV